MQEGGRCLSTPGAPGAALDTASFPTMSPPATRPPCTGVCTWPPGRPSPGSRSWTLGPAWRCRAPLSCFPPSTTLFISAPCLTQIAPSLPAGLTPLPAAWSPAHGTAPWGGTGGLLRVPCLYLSPRLARKSPAPGAPFRAAWEEAGPVAGVQGSEAARHGHCLPPCSRTPGVPTFPSLSEA